MMTTRTRLLAFSLVMTSLCGCTLPRRVLTQKTEPKATVRSIRTASFDRQRADLALLLEIENPGAALVVTGAVYEILAQGRPFATGTLDLQFTVPANGHADVTLPVELTYLDLPYAARNRLRQGGAVQLVARGALRAGSAPSIDLIEFNGETEAGAPRENDAP